MSGLIEAAGSLLDPRRVATVWLPVAAFLAGLGAIVVGALGPTDALAAWNGLGGPGQAVCAAALLVVSVLLAGLVDARRVSLTRLLEGYLPPWLGGLADRLRRRHQCLRDTLAAAERRRRYPHGQVRPTRIGNTIAAAEEHGERYGLDTVSTWPRLYPTLPEHVVAAFGATAGSLHAMSTLCVLGSTFALIGGLVAMFLLPWWGTLACVLAGSFVAIAAYHGAARAAVPYAEMIRSAYDVHRWQLLDAMGLRRPTSFAQERAQWNQLSKLWQLGLLDSGGSAVMRYPLPVGATETSASPTPTSAPDITTPTTSTTTTDHDGGVEVRLVLAVAALALGAALVGGTMWRAHTLTVLPGHGNELRAVTDIPAYKPLTCADVRDGGGPEERADVVGRYPLRTIPRDDPVPTTRLGPKVGVDALAGRAVTTLATTTSTAATAVPRGARVTVILVPPASPTGLTPAVVVTDVLVLDVLSIAPTQLVVALPADRLTLLDRPGTVSLRLDPMTPVPPSTPTAPPRPC